MPRADTMPGLYINVHAATARPALHSILQLPEPRPPPMDPMAKLKKQFELDVLFGEFREQSVDGASGSRRRAADRRQRAQERETRTRAERRRRKAARFRRVDDRAQELNAVRWKVDEDAERERQVRLNWSVATHAAHVDELRRVAGDIGIRRAEARHRLHADAVAAASLHMQARAPCEPPKGSPQRLRTAPPLRSIRMNDQVVGRLGTPPEPQVMSPSNLPPLFATQN
eukprot:Hpha_TRINITY_DN17954_c0_g1::TRINITY_DN17954_c0_g1_i1::g.33748::m.33748